MGGTEYSDRFVALRMVIGWSPGQDASTRPQFLVVTVNPNGVVSAPRGSFALREDAGNANIYQNTDGVMAWQTFGGASNSQNVISRLVGPGAGTYDSTAVLPAGGFVSLQMIQILTAFDGAATISIGTAASPSLFMTTNQNQPSVLNSLDQNPQVTSYAGTPAVRTTIGGAPTVGSARIWTAYAVPLT